MGHLLGNLEFQFRYLDHDKSPRFYLNLWMLCCAPRAVRHGMGGRGLVGMCLWQYEAYIFLSALFFFFGRILQFKLKEGVASSTEASW
jgi:hypothetical protein